MGATARQLESHRHGIGGADAAAIVDLDPYKTKLHVWARLRGIDVPRRETEGMGWGLALERAVALRWMAESGLVTRPSRRTWRHPKYRYIIGHLDGAVGDPYPDGGQDLLEVKTARSDRDWGEDQTNSPEAIPAWYRPQVMHYAGLTGARTIHVAVLIGGSEFRRYAIPADPAWSADQFEAERDFHETYVVTGIEPPAGPSGRDILRLIHPDSGPQMVHATAEQEALIGDYRAAELAADNAAARAEELRALIVQIIGDDLGLEGPFGRITYRRSKDWQKVHWDLIAAGLRRSIEQARSIRDLRRIDWDALISLHSETQRGSRRWDQRFRDDRPRLVEG
jgi:putative phage-type endonuclease